MLTGVGVGRGWLMWIIGLRNNPNNPNNKNVNTAVKIVSTLICIIMVSLWIYALVQAIKCINNGKRCNYYSKYYFCFPLFTIFLIPNSIIKMIYITLSYSIILLK